ncbi:MAG: nucleotidyltransferase family protein [Armatimonadota bacterium]
MELDEALRELKRELEALYGDRLRGLFLFGSHARGDAHPESDQVPPRPTRPMKMTDHGCPGR